MTYTVSWKKVEYANREETGFKNVVFLIESSQDNLRTKNVR